MSAPLALAPPPEITDLLQLASAPEARGGSQLLESSSSSMLGTSRSSSSASSGSPTASASAATGDFVSLLLSSISLVDSSLSVGLRVSPLPPSLSSAVASTPPRFAHLASALSAPPPPSAAASAAGSHADLHPVAGKGPRRGRIARAVTSRFRRVGETGGGGAGASARALVSSASSSSSGAASSDDDDGGRLLSDDAEGKGGPSDGGDGEAVTRASAGGERRGDEAGNDEEDRAEVEPATETSAQCSSEERLNAKAGGRETSGGETTTNENAAASRRFDWARGWTKSLLGESTSKVAPTSATPPSQTHIVSKRRVSMWAPTFGSASALIHADMDSVLRSLFDASSPYFLLGFVSVGSPSSSLRHHAGGNLPAAAGSVLAPLVVNRVGDHEVHLLVYTLLREDSNVVAETLLRLVRVEGFHYTERDDDNHSRLDEVACQSDGASSDCLLYFHALPKDFGASVIQAANAVKERRAQVQSRYTVVDGRQFGAVKLSQAPHGCCSAFMAVSLQYDVAFLPDAAVRRLLKSRMAALKGLQQKHEKCAEIDERAALHFVQFTLPKAPAPNDDERSLLDASLKFKDLPDSAFRRLAGSLKLFPTVQMFEKTATTNSRLICSKCYGDIDESMEKVLAWNWLLGSYERVREHRNRNGDVVSRVVTTYSCRTQVHESEFKVSQGIANRFAVTSSSWFMLGTEMFGRRACCIAFKTAQSRRTQMSMYASVSSFSAKSIEPPAVSAGTKEAVAFSKRAIESSFEGLLLFEELTSRITKFTVVQEVGFGGALPGWMAHSLATQELGIVLRAQQRFRRGDKVIDREMREHIASQMRESSVVSPPAAERESYNACYSLMLEFDKEDNQHAVKVLKSESPFVVYSTFVADPQSGSEKRHERVGTGKGFAPDIDADMEVAAAWLFDGCSRERMRINAEDNRNLPRIILRKNSESSIDMASVKLLPFPLSKRDFVVRLSWIKLAENALAIAMWPTNENVDYGMTGVNLVRGATSAINVIRATGAQSCSVAIYQKLDVGGLVPVSLMNSKVHLSLSSIFELRSSLQRDETVDAEKRRALVDRLVSEKEDEADATTDVSEGFPHDGILKAVADAVRTDAGRRSKPVEGVADHLVETFLLRASKGSSTSGSSSKKKRKASSGRIRRQIVSAEATVDAPIEECVAWALLACSRQRSQSFFDLDGGMFRSGKELGPRSSEFTDTYIIDYRVRAGVKKVVYETFWKKGRLGLTYTVIVREKNNERHGIVTQTKFFVAPRATGGEIHETKVSMKVRLRSDLLLSSDMMSDEALAPLSTRSLSEMRRFFDKSAEIDASKRCEFRKILEANKETYSPDENSLLDSSSRIIVEYAVAAASRKTTSVSSFSPLTTSTMAYISNDQLVWGRAVTTVRAPIAELLAFLWESKARNQWKAGTLKKEYLNTPNAHHRVEYILKKGLGTGIFSNREFTNALLWKLSIDGTAILISLPTPEQQHRTSDGSAPGQSASVGVVPIVRGVFKCVYQLKVSASSAQTSAVIYLQLDYGLAIPKVLQERFLKSNLKRLTDSQEYFQCLRTLHDYDEADGTAVGEMFMLKAKDEVERRSKGSASKNQARVAKVVNSVLALKQFSAINPWFPSLIEGMLNNWLRDPVMIRTTLDNLSGKEALSIGKSFSLALQDRQTAETGADMFINEYSSLVELKKRQRFFSPMVIVIGQRKLERAVWGLWFQLWIGAALAILDLATDINAIVVFTMQGKHSFANAVIVMVSVSATFQIMLVAMNGMKRGKMHIVKEALIVLSGFKPVVDAIRVGRGHSAHVDDALDPMFEMICAKIIEIVAESIPSSLIQIYNTFTSEKRNFQLIASIIVSIATISFVTTTINFDFDLSPYRRAHSPEFYGYAPNTYQMRVVVFVTMVLFSACHIAIRMSGIALLAVLSPALTGAVLGGDMLFFLLFKMARRDLRYWLNVDGVISWLLSFFVRFFTKALVDFTVMVQLRHPMELGGLYWCTCLLLGQGTSFFAVHAYAHPEVLGLPSSFERHYSEDSLWTLVATVEACFIVFFLAFVATIERRYIRTFFTRTTGKQFNVKLFRAATDDLARLSIFTSHPSYYASIRDEVKKWVGENYGVWVEERPEFFTERVKASIPLDMIPAAYNERQGFRNVRNK